jgi:G6PDH family F420-dependent oxidoreductase
MRYHPAVVAQKAATIQLLSDGRFTLGLGAGENLNEHVIGRGWPPADVRHVMLTEALDIITALLAGETVTYRGDYLETENARLWDPPGIRPPIGVAVSGPRSCEIAGRYADAMIAVQPEAGLGELFDRAGGAGKPRIGQVAISYDPDETAALKRAHEQFRWFLGGWKVMAELPGPKHFAAASKAVTEQVVARGISCGPNVADHVESVKKFVDAGFTHIALVQVGGDSQEPFFDWAQTELLHELKKLGGTQRDASAA